MSLITGFVIAGAGIFGLRIVKKAQPRSIAHMGGAFFVTVSVLSAFSGLYLMLVRPF
jgi:hypothetical protein